MNLIANKGIPRHILLLMAAMAGITVANLYYNQPLLEMIHLELGISQSLANLITVITQVGYSLGLFFIIPTGDLYSRRKVIVLCMVIAGIMAGVIGMASNIYLIWGASMILGCCSVVPQLFIPIAGQFSKPEDKTKNMGIVLSGLITGILAARIVSGITGELWGWRAIFYADIAIMFICLILTLLLLPEMSSNYQGNYVGLMKSVGRIFVEHRQIRVNSLRAACAFGSLVCIWSCLAFHLAEEPFHAGSDMVGMLGACGVVGAIMAGGIGKYIQRYGVRRFTLWGAMMQVTGWAVAYLFGYTYTGIIMAIILVDVGIQFQQLSNQSACIQAVPEASNRANTIFMTTYFIGGSLGTFLAGQGWKIAGWSGVCTVGCILAISSILITFAFDKAESYSLKETKNFNQNLFKNDGNSK